MSVKFTVTLPETVEGGVPVTVLASSRMQALMMVTKAKIESEKEKAGNFRPTHIGWSTAKMSRGSVDTYPLTEAEIRDECVAYVANSLRVTRSHVKKHLHFAMFDLCEQVEHRFRFYGHSCNVVCPKDAMSLSLREFFDNHLRLPLMNLASDYKTRGSL